MDSLAFFLLLHQWLSTRALEVVMTYMYDANGIYWVKASDPTITGDVLIIKDFPTPNVNHVEVEMS